MFIFPKLAEPIASLNYWSLPPALGRPFRQQLTADNTFPPHHAISGVFEPILVDWPTLKSSKLQLPPLHTMRFFDQRNHPFLQIKGAKERHIFFRWREPKCFSMVFQLKIIWGVLEITIHSSCRIASSVSAAIGTSNRSNRSQWQESLANPTRIQRIITYPTNLFVCLPPSAREGWRRTNFLQRRGKSLEKTRQTVFGG